MNVDVDAARLEAAVTGWLDDGPVSITDLASRAVQAGILPEGVDDDGFEAEDVIVALNEQTDAWWTISDDDGDDVLVAVRTFTDNAMTFTHRVTAEELELDEVFLQPDLTVLLWEHFDGLDLVDGSGRVQARFANASQSTLTGPSGWLEGIGPGDLVAFTRTDERVTLTVVDEDRLGDPDAEVAALVAAAEDWVPVGRGMDEVPIVMDALSRDHRVFHTPVFPLGELLVGIGLERRGHEWGWVGEDWHTFTELYDRNGVATRGRYQLDRCCDLAFDRLEAAWRAFSAGQTVNAPALADDLDHGAVPQAFAHVHADSATRMGDFADALVAALPKRHRAGAHALAGFAHLRASDPVAALDRFRQAVHVDPESPVAAEWLAVLEMDRGNVDQAAAVAVRAGVHDESVGWITREQTRRRAMVPNVGRNEKCPCASGRKFKQCCARKTSLDLGDRVPLVMRRLGRFAAGPDGHEVRFAVSLAAATGHTDLAGALQRFADNGFLLDVAIFEGGLGRDYRAQRGRLLPDDEAALLDVLLAEPRRLLEIVDVVSGQSLTVRDSATGEVITVGEHSGSMDRAPGELVLARMVVVQGEPVLVGIPVLVPPDERDRVAALADENVGADEVAEWYGSRSSLPA